MTTPTATPRLWIPGGWQMSLRFNQYGQESVVVLGAAGPSGGMTNAKAAEWRDAATAAFRPLFVSGVSVQGATVRDVGQRNGTVIELGPPATANGSSTASSSHAAACTLIKWSTARGGRSGKGRSYIPGLPYTALNGDGRTYATAFATAIATAASQYLNAALWSVDYKPVVLSFRTGTGTVITGGAAAPVAGTQRRRMR